jgi:glycosyltransferase involved in cell wall biosynthesis
LLTYFRPVNYGLWRNLKDGKVDAFIIYGHNLPFHWLVMLQAKIHGDKVFVRDEATLLSKKRGYIRRALNHIFDLFDAFVKTSISISSKSFLINTGDGELKSLLRRRIRALGSDAARFLGFRNQKELPAHYALCDVFALTSSSETWGLVVNEAINAGKAIIVSDIVGCGYD